MAVTEDMEIQGRNSVIHRKAKVARDGFDARAMSPAKALRLSLAKTADTLLNLAVTVTTVEQLPLAQANIQKEVGDDGLLLLLDGMSGQRGAMKVDPQFLSALIEVQTTGTVQKSEVAPRPVTQTDAAMCAPLADALLAGFEQQLHEAFGDQGHAGFRFGVMVEDGRTLSLAMQLPEYELFRLSVNVHDGAKTGVLTLILPIRQPVPKPDQLGDAPAISVGKLETNVLCAPIVLDAVLARLAIPLRDVCAFKPGMTLPIPTASLSETHLVATKGHVVSDVRLGQLHGWRAVRFAGTGAVSSDWFAREADAPAQLDDDKPESEYMNGKGGDPDEGLSILSVSADDVMPEVAAGEEAENPESSPPDEMSEFYESA